MTSNYAPRLFILIFISLMVLMLGPFATRLPVWVATIAAGLPLAWYHLGYLRPMAKSGLSQAAIDSVYYFGFLVTLGALATSAISLAGQETLGLKGVGIQFGLGLLATGYAIVARIDLTSLVAQTDVIDPEVAMANLADRSRELLVSIELATARFSGFAESLLTSSNRSIEQASGEAQGSMRASTQIFEKGLKQGLDVALGGLQDLRSLIQDATFATERRELARSISSTVKQLKALETTLAETTKAAQAGTTVVERVVPALGHTAEIVTKLNSGLELLHHEDHGFGAFAQNIRNGSALVEGASQSLSQATTELTHVSEIIGDIGPTLKSLRATTKKATEQIEALAEISTLLETTTRSMQSLTNSGDQFSVTFGAVLLAVESLKLGTEKLSSEIAQATPRMESFSNALQTLPSQVKGVDEFGRDLGAALASVRAASERLTSVPGLSGGMLGGDQDGQPINSVEHALARLTTTIERFEAAVNDATSSLKSSIAQSTKALEDDVQRSSQATSLLSSKLVSVAQHIIDGVKHGAMQ